MSDPFNETTQRALAEIDPLTVRFFLAEHGSLNRGEKIGYRITLVRIKDNAAVSYENFASGWYDGKNVCGRPVDLEILDDGSMIVSDDNSGNLYRIYYQAQ